MAPRIYIFQSVFCRSLFLFFKHFYIMVNSTIWRSTFSKSNSTFATIVRREHASKCTCWCSFGLRWRTYPQEKQLNGRDVKGIMFTFNSRQRQLLLISELWFSVNKDQSEREKNAKEIDNGKRFGRHATFFGNNIGFLCAAREHQSTFQSACRNVRKFSTDNLLIWWSDHIQ